MALEHVVSVSGRPSGSVEGTVSPLWQPRGFLALLAAYGLVHVGLRLLVSSVLTIDDSRETVFGQTLEWGYLPRQPPLYNWLVWGTFRVFGVGPAGLAVVKYGLLSLAYLFVYLSARRVLPDVRLAALAAWSLLLMIPIGWVVHADLTHSVAVLAASAATFYALIRLAASGSLGIYAALGLALGLGMLAKFSYALFAAALLAAAVSVPEFRSRILGRGMLFALGVAAVLVLPYMTWFYARDFSLARMYAREVHAEPGAGYLERAGAGLYYIARVALYYLTPLWIVLLAVFPDAWRRRAAASGPAPAARRLLERFFVVELALLLAGALAGELAYLKFRWMMPAFFLFPLCVLSRVDPGAVDRTRVRRLGGLLLAAELAIVVAFVATVYRGDRLGRPSRLNAPYDVVAARLAAAGFVRGTIVAGEGALGGNLRLRFPDSRVVTLESPHYVPPTPGGGQCLVVWERGRDGGVPRELRDLLATSLEVELTGRERTGAVEAAYRFAATRTLRVHYLLLPDGAGRCR